MVDSNISEENQRAIQRAVDQVPKDVLLAPFEVVSASLYQKIEAEGEDLITQGTRWYVEVELHNLYDDTTAWALYRVWQSGDEGLKATRVELAG